MPTVTERLLTDAKIVINWYGLYVEGCTNTVQYELYNVRTYKRLIFKVAVKHIEECVGGVCNAIDSLTHFGMKFKIYVNDRYVAESQEIGEIKVGDVYEIDGTNTILPYISDGRNNFKCCLGIPFVTPTHAGYHVYVDVDMIIEDSPEIKRIGIVMTPSEMLSAFFGTILALIQPFLPYIILFFIVFILIRIII